MSKKKVVRSGNIIFKRDPSFASCPSCGEQFSLRRSRARNFFENVVRSLTFYKTYRCNKCGWRGFRSTIIMTWQSVKNLVLYLMIAGATIFVVRIVLQRMAG